MSAVDHWRKRIQRVLWPCTCVLCAGAARPELDLCCDCQADLPSNTDSCSVCAQPLADAAASVWTCGACLRRAPLFQASVIPFRYAYPLDHLIHSFKYARNLAVGRVLAQLLAQHISAGRRDALPVFMIPVPLAPGRYRSRGYNQAVEIALHLRRLLGVPLRTDLIERSRETREQAELDRKERRANVRRAFRIATASVVAARHVAIVDDVVTTGSTVNEVAKVLRRGGAQRIEVWALARAGNVAS